MGTADSLKKRRNGRAGEEPVRNGKKKGVAGYNRQIPQSEAGGRRCDPFEDGIPAGHQNGIFGQRQPKPT